MVSSSRRKRIIAQNYSSMKQFNLNWNYYNNCTLKEKKAFVWISLNSKLPRKSVLTNE